MRIAQILQGQVVRYAHTGRLHSTDLKQVSFVSTSQVILVLVCLQVKVVGIGNRRRAAVIDWEFKANVSTAITIRVPIGFKV